MHIYYYHFSICITAYQHPYVNVFRTFGDQNRVLSGNINEGFVSYLYSFICK